MAMRNMKRSHLTERIGDAEGNHLPNKTEKNRGLASQVEEKRKLLEHLMRKVELSRADRNDIENELENTKAENELEDEKSQQEIQLLDAENRKTQKEVDMLRKTIESEDLTFQEIRRKVEMKEKEYEDALSKQVEESAEKLKYNDQLKYQEHYKSDLEQNHATDERVVGELEAYLKRMAQSIFERQKQLEDIRAGLVNGKSELDGARRRLRDENRRQKELKKKLDESMKKIDRNNGTKDDEIPTNPELPSVSDAVEGYQKQKESLEKMRNEIDDKEREWIAIQAQITKSENIQAEAQSKDDYEYAKQKRYQTKIDILKLEPTPTMYRSYEKSLHAKDTSNQTKDKLKRAAEKRKELQQEQKVTKEKTDTLNALKKELESTRTKLNDYDRISDQMLRALGKDKNDPQLKEANELRKSRKKIHKPRKQMLLEQQREAESQLKSEVKMMKDKVDLGIRDTDGMEEKLKELQIDIEKKAMELQNYNRKISTVKKKTEEKLQEQEAERVRLEEKKQQKEKSCAHEVEQLIEEKQEVEHQLHDLKIKMQTLDQEHARFNHKLQTMISWKKTENPAEIRKLGDEAGRWRDIVSETEKEFDAISIMVRDARENNAKVRKDLAVVKPYFSEYAEFEQLRERERQLDRELKDAQTAQNLRKWQREGDLLFEN